jgi:hypothetical protein
METIVAAGLGAAASADILGGINMIGTRSLATGRPVIYVKSVHPRRGQSMKPWQLLQWAKIREQQVVNFSSVEDVNRAIRRFERYRDAHPGVQERQFPRHIRERYKLALAVKAGMRELAKEVQGEK